MTTWEMLRAVGRRWYVALFGVLVTCALCVWVRDLPGVYWTTADVYFIAPSGPVPGQIGETSDALVSTAGLVEREVNVQPHQSNPVSPDVTIVGMGIYDGTFILLPNSGGQWDHNFQNPLLQVSSSAPTAQEAATKRDDAIRRVEVALKGLQDRDNVHANARITTRLVPDNPQVVYDQGKPTRAAAALFMLGIGLTATTCVVIDGLILRRRRRRREQPAPSRELIAAET